MRNAYRRRPPVSRLERLLARLLLSQQRSGNAGARMDLAYGEEVSFTQA